MAKKLLLADDSITIQKVVELVLSEEDFQIKAVNNGQDALEQMEPFKPDIVLADIEMPQVNGYQLCERIKQNSATSQVPVLLLAGAFEPLDDDLANNVGADGYIIKPFESQELISKVNAALTSASLGAAPAAEAVVATADEEPAFEAAVIEEQSAAEPVMAMEAAEAVEEDLWAVEEVEEQAEDAWALPEEPEVVAEEAEPVAAELDVAEPMVEMDIPRPPGEPQELRRPPEAEKKPSATIAARSWEQPVEKQVSQAPAPAPAFPSGEEVAMVIREVVQEQISAVMQEINISQLIHTAVSEMVKLSIEQAVSDTVPKLLESSISDMLAGSFSNIRGDIEKVIWETVPDMAETLIRKEIEKIKSGS